MNIDVEWEKPVPLHRSKQNGFIYECDLERVPNERGVYVFGRQYGKRFEALYVGQASRLCTRIQSHLNNLRLMSRIRDSKNGSRVLLLGCLKTKPGQDWKRCLTIVERALLRYFVAEGHDLVNKQGTRLRRHTITSTGGIPKKKPLFPLELQLERS